MPKKTHHYTTSRLSTFSREDQFPRCFPVWAVEHRVHGPGRDEWLVPGVHEGKDKRTPKPIAAQNAASRWRKDSSPTMPPSQEYSRRFGWKARLRSLLGAAREVQELKEKLHGRCEPFVVSAAATWRHMRLPSGPAPEEGTELQGRGITGTANQLSNAVARNQAGGDRKATGWDARATTVAALGSGQGVGILLGRLGGLALRRGP